MFLNYNLQTKMLQTPETFRSSGTFLTGNNDGSVSLFNGSKLIKTKELSGTSVTVGYFNGQIIAAARTGKVTVMDENLGVIKELGEITDSSTTICGNSTYLAFCINRFVLYYKINGNMQPKVILLYFSTESKPTLR